MRKLAILVPLFLITVAFGQQQPQEGEVLNPYLLLETPQQIAEVINTAESELLVAAETLHHQEVAEALRKAMVERGIPVFLLSTEAGANENSSFIHSVTLMGANVRVLAEVEPMIIVDRTYVVAGPLISRAAAPTAVENETFLLSDPDHTSRVTSYFVDLFEQATVFEYQPTF